jgi:hypothetical protein
MNNVSRNSNNLTSGVLKNLLKNLGDTDTATPVAPVQSEVKVLKPKLPKPTADQSLSSRRISGAHHNSGAMGGTGWCEIDDTKPKSGLDDMLRRLGK